MLKKINAAWLQVEKTLVVIAFLAMSLVVFAEVVHRKAADTAWQTPSSLAVLAGVLWGLSVAAVRTATKGASPWLKSALWGLVGPVGVFSLCWGLLKLTPTGLPWAQPLALVLTIWVGFLGASIAAAQNKHLKVDAAEKLFRGSAKQWVGLVGSLLAALGTGALAALAIRYCHYEYVNYLETEGTGGVFSGLALPKYLGFSIIPIALISMTLRFVAAGWASFHSKHNEVAS